MIENAPWAREESARQVLMRRSLTYLASISTPPGGGTGDGVRDFSDVLDFLEDFASAHSSADLVARRGECDFSDVLEFLTRFGAPCG